MGIEGYDFRISSGEKTFEYSMFVFVFVDLVFFLQQSNVIVIKCSVYIVLSNRAANSRDQDHYQ